MVADVPTNAFLPTMQSFGTYTQPSRFENAKAPCSITFMVLGNVIRSRSEYAKAYALIFVTGLSSMRSGISNLVTPGLVPVIAT